MDQAHRRHGVVQYSGVKTFVNGPCTKCGGIFTQGHLSVCPAKQSHCYACGRIGHYARLCFHTKPSGFQGQASHNITSTNQDGQQQVHVSTKSSSKRRRDKQRIQAYRQRQRLQGILPFASLSDEDFPCFSINRNRDAHQSLISKILIVSKRCALLEKENQELNNTIQNCLSKYTELQNLHDLDKRTLDVVKTESQKLEELFHFQTNIVASQAHHMKEKDQCIQRLQDRITIYEEREARQHLDTVCHTLTKQESTKRHHDQSYEVDAKRDNPRGRGRQQRRGGQSRGRYR